MIPPRKLLRALLLACGWLLLFVALCGPHTSWSVCLTGHCHHHGDAVAAEGTAGMPAVGDCCCCLRTEHARVALANGEFGHDAPCPRGCCVDFMIAVESGPLPTPIVAPAPLLPLVAVLDVPAAVPLDGRHVDRFAYHDTGPPRPDAKAALRLTTVLRE